MSTQEDVGDLQLQQKSYFCHSCQLEFRKNPDEDFLCPRCRDGFVEELPENSNNSSNQNSEEQDDSQFMRGVFNDFSMGPFQMSTGNNNTSYYRIANEILGPIITGGLGLASTSSTQAEPSDGSSSSNGSNPGHLGRRRPGQRRQAPINFEDILQEILLSITDGGNSGRAPMFFMGNPGDYAWGREGLDTIVTQLLNQMDNAGPPPLDQEKIAEIPKCEIDQEQVDSKLQCSVCWDDFQLKELVRQLPCSHVYHESCILPWLKLHGTCPICRKLLVSEDENNANAASQVANQLRLSIGGQASTSHEGNDSAMDATNNSSNSNENASEPTNRRRDDVEFDFD